MFSSKEDQLKHQEATMSAEIAEQVAQLQVKVSALLQQA